MRNLSIGRLPFVEGVKGQVQHPRAACTILRRFCHKQSQPDGVPPAPQRAAVSIEQPEIRIILTEESGIEDQVVAGSFLPLANIERVRETVLLVVVHGKAIAIGIDLDGDQRCDVRTLFLRIPDGDG